MTNWKNLTRVFFMFLFFSILIKPALVHAEPYKVGLVDFPPFATIDKSGKYSGIMVELLEKVLKRAEISYEVAPFPQKRLFKNLATGETDIYMGVKGVPYYEGKVLFSDVAVCDIDLRAYCLKKTPPIQARHQLKGKSIIVIMGYGYGGLIGYLKDPANRITLDPTATHVLAFRKLKAKRAQYVLDYRRPATMAIDNEKMTENVDFTSIAKLNIYFIVSKKAPEAQRLMKRMEEAYQALKAEEKR